MLYSDKHCRAIPRFVGPSTIAQRKILNIVDVEKQLRCSIVSENCKIEPKTIIISDSHKNLYNLFPCISTHYYIY